MERTIGVIGLWHLGCVLCASWYKLGNKVIGFDFDKSRVDKLKKGIPPLFEPNLSETIQSGLDNNKLSFSNETSSLSTCDFIFLSFDTPVLEDDTSNTTILKESVNSVRKVMKNGSILIVSSQSPVGFCNYLRNRLKEANSTLELAYSPENLRLGEAIECYINPGRIILGTADIDAEKECKNLFSAIRAEILSMGLESAEMVKHGINSFLSNSIVFANHLADICEEYGANIDDVTRGMKSDPRIGKKAYLSPGIGFSGGTLGRDLKVLEQKNQAMNGYAKLFGLIHQLNQERKFSIVSRIEKILGSLKNCTIGVLGLTYKPGTSTLRRSLPLDIINLLIDKNCKIKAYDPKADFAELSSEPRFSISSGIKEVADAVDLLLLLTEWQDFKDYDWKDIPKIMNKPLLFDTKNFMEKKVMVSFGFDYYSVGR